MPSTSTYSYPLTQNSILYDHFSEIISTHAGAANHPTHGLGKRIVRTSYNVAMYSYVCIE